MKLILILLFLLGVFDTFVWGCDGDLYIKISARGLSDKDNGGNDYSDPFFKLYIRTNEFYRSCTHDNNHNPNWNNGIKIKNGEILRIHYRDHDSAANDDDMGWCNVPIANLRRLRIGETTECNVFGEGGGYSIITRVESASGSSCSSGNCWC